MEKVLYITNLPAPYRITFFDELSKKVDLTVVYERDRASNRNEKWIDSKEQHSFKEFYLPSIRIGEEASLSMKIIPFLKEKYDAILVGGYSSPTIILTITYMKLHKIKFGIVCDGMLPRNDSKLKRRFKTFLVSSASFWMSSGDITTEQLEKYGAKKERIFKYPFSSIMEKEIANFEELSVDKKSEYKNKIGCKEDKMILYVGQIIERKGVDILLKAFKKLNLPNTRLMIVGGKNDGHDENISYIEFKKKEELLFYYRAADVFVLPTREDIWGLVVNEALSNGVPVVTTYQCGAGLEMIQDNVNGYLVNSGDVDALSKTIQLVFANNELPQGTISTAKQFTIEKMVARTEEIISCVCRAW